MTPALDAMVVEAACPPHVDAAIRGACARVAPLWPLKHFVAVNPFLGFAGQGFGATCALMRRVAGVDMLMPRAFYRQAVADGVVGDADLAAGLAAVDGAPGSVAALRQALAEDAAPARPGAVVATVAEVLDRLATGDRDVSRTAFMVDEVSRWCAAYFDEGQASWRLPSRGLPPYAAWRATMRHDRNAEAMGVRGFRAAVAGLPEDPVAAVAAVVAALGIPARAVEDYLHRALLDVGGWAAYARYRGWDAGLAGEDDDTLVQVLAIRVAWGFALFQGRTDAAFQQAWRQAMADAAALPDDAGLGGDPALAADLALQEAYEAAFRRRLLARLRDGAARPAGQPATRPLVQAAFCIDVRSEVLRRALETVCPGAETVGFAGFFGFPIEYVPIGRTRGGAQCPVLLRPGVVVCEAVAGATEEERTEVLGLRLLRRRAVRAWKAFKLSAVSSFTYVETVGLGFAAKLLGDAAGLTRPAPDPGTDGLDRGVIARVGPRLDPAVVAGRATGLDPARRLAMAEAVLRAMSMTGGFAGLVMLTGHGSTTVNNPHASGLDCGACGGHTGEANARVAAAVLNDPGVRAGLRGRGILVPDDTWFLGCLHDTVTDEVRIFDTDQVPAAHAADLAQLRVWLSQAAALARTERAALLGLPPAAGRDGRVAARGRDWAQVRPEWGLAGNAAFIAAPRARTRGLDLGGRVFLHSYDWREDAGFGVLALILTAPMVVASWINLQYYGSAVNNRVFGSGNKVLHNVVGQLGVLEGNAGDLKVGLPWQSVHDGTRLVHEPLRLTVLVEAPEAEIDRVVAAHPGVRDLVGNGWLHLFALAEDGTARRRARDGGWA